MSAVVWAQGAFRAADEVRIGLSDRGFLLGDGVFDTFRIAAGAPRRLAAHLARLRATAETFGLALSFSNAEIEAAARGLAERNGLSDAAARLTLSRGEGPRGVAPPEPASPFIVMTMAARGAPPAWIDAGLSEVVRPASALTSRHKTLSYIENVEARRRAAAAGHGEALMCNERGELACATAANLFWISEGALVTPSLDCGVLPGVTRAWLLDNAGAAGLTAREGRFRPEALMAAEAAFVTNSVLGVVPLQRLSGVEGSAEFDPEHETVLALRGAEDAAQA